MKKRLLILLLAANYVGLSAQEELPVKKISIPFDLEEQSLYGYAQVGYNYRPATDTYSLDVNRIVFGLSAKIVNKLTAGFLYDFGPNARMHEYWAEYGLSSTFNVRAGQFKVPLTLENQLSLTKLEVINGTQAVTYLAGGGEDPRYPGKGGRDTGVQLSGDLLTCNEHSLVNYKIGLFNGQGMNVTDKNNQKDIAAMLTITPSKTFTLSGSIYSGKIHYKDLDQEANYTRNRWSVGGLWTTKPFYIRAEYIAGDDETAKRRGYYATANIHLCPKFDLLTTYDFFNKEVSLGRKQTNYVAGLQYSFYKTSRMQVMYTHQDKPKGEGYFNLVTAQFQVVF